MANRRRTGVILGVLWLISIALLVAGIVYFGDSRVQGRSGFPYMPVYGAVTWWFFLTIPLIGATYGFFNDWKRK